MMHDNLRCQAIAAAILFAPIRRASEDMEGPADIHTAKIQSNRFSRSWITDEHISYAEVRPTFVDEWSRTVDHLRGWFDAVAAVQVELSVRYQWTPSEPGLRASLRVRRAMPGLGTMVVQFTPDGDSGGVTVHAAMLGHPGTPAVSELAKWLDTANAAVESVVTSLATTPAARAREAYL